MPTHDPAQSRRPVNVCDSADLAPSAHPERGPQPPSPSSPLGRRRKPGLSGAEGVCSRSSQESPARISGEFSGIPPCHPANKESPSKRPRALGRGQRPDPAPPPHSRGAPSAGNGGQLSSRRAWGFAARGGRRKKSNRVRTWRKKKGERGALGKEAARLPCLRQAFAI